MAAPEKLFAPPPFFKCGTLQGRGKCKAVTVTKLNDINNIIIPFFQKYPLLGAKRLDYADFCKVAKLMAKKVHLTPDGLDEIIKIQAGMNTGRDYSKISDSDSGYESEFR